jgi:acrylyl-CoA reductase (NADPH)
MFKAIQLTRDGDQFAAAVRDLDDAALAAATPDDDVTLAVEYSTINYKDGLALTNKGPVVRAWPMVAGIDAAGTVLDSRSAAWKPGDRVILTGWGVGESHWGGLAQRARFKGDWLVALPAGMTSRQAMAIGTAGFTAMLCVLALEGQGVTPAAGEVLVTGAAGGVGSVALALLSQRGYRVVASTGRAAEGDYLKSLGAAEVIDRATLSAPGKPLQKERWGAVIDSVGSHTLANAVAQTRYGGTIAACGLAQGMDLPSTVAPFILRGCKLVGVDSVMCPLSLRRQAWQRLATDLDRAKLDAMTRVVPLAGALDVAHAILAGQVRGRVVVDVNA